MSDEIESHIQFQRRTLPASPRCCQGMAGETAMRRRRALGGLGAGAQSDRPAPDLALALRAVSVQFVAVPQDAEVVALGDLVLGLLDHLALELDDLPAPDAHE